METHWTSDSKKPSLQKITSSYRRFLFKTNYMRVLGNDVLYI